ncbi:MAG: AMP-binding protein [Fimbriimonadales bacterium]|nr:AMP-binding protein [Fimbriimonadales bacterium]
MWGAVNAFARGLREELGIQAGDRVSIMLPNLPQFVIAYHALA